MIQQGKVLQKIRNLLVAISEVNNLTQGRIYHIRLRQNEQLPAVTYQIVDVQPEETKDGIATYENHRVQFNAYANRDDEVIQLLDHIRENFDRMTDESGTIKIHHARFIDRSALIYEMDLNLYYSNLDIDLHIKE